MDTTTFVRTLRALVDGEDAFLGAIERVSAFDPAAYAEALETHRLMPWVEPAVLSEAGRRRLPSTLVTAVESRREARRRRHEEVVAETLEVADVLTHAGVSCLHLKGLSFGVRFYGDPRRRHQRDVDVLVPERERDAAICALERVGYELEPGDMSDGVVRRGLRRGYAAVDVHWSLRRRARHRLDAAELWKGPVPFQVAGRTLETPSDAITLLFLLLSLAEDLRRGACTARHFLDLHRVLHGLSRRLDIEDFLARRARQALDRPCVNVLAVFLVLWSAAPDLPDVARAVERRRHMVVIAGLDDARGLVERPASSPESEAWFGRAYPYSRLGGWARRWSFGLPLTLARLPASRRFTLGLEPRAAESPRRREGGTS